MIHRAVVERDTSAGTDAWNRPAVPSFTAHKTIPCRAWSKQRKHVRDDGKQVVVSDLRAIFPADADIQITDQITAINDRQGSALFSGPLSILTLTPRGAQVRFREAMLEAHV